MRSNEELIKDGYLTIDQWTEKLSIVIRAHLKESVFPYATPTDLFHPEDLVANTGAMLDALAQFLPEFGKQSE